MTDEEKIAAVERKLDGKLNWDDFVRIKKKRLSSYALPAHFALPETIEKEREECEAMTDEEKRVYYGACHS
jgi:hypothetical protein